MLVINERAAVPRSEQRVLDWMRTWKGQYIIVGLAISGCHVPRRHGETDPGGAELVVITPRAVVVVEVRDTVPDATSGVLSVRAAGPWRLSGFDGDPLRDAAEPFEQVADNLGALKDLVREHHSDAYVDGVIVVVPPWESTVVLEVETPQQGCGVVLGSTPGELRAWLHRTSNRKLLWTAEAVHALLEDLELDHLVSLEALLAEGFPSATGRRRGAALAGEPLATTTAYPDHLARPAQRRLAETGRPGLLLAPAGDSAYAPNGPEPKIPSAPREAAAVESAHQPHTDPPSSSRGDGVDEPSRGEPAGQVERAGVDPSAFADPVRGAGRPVAVHEEGEAGLRQAPEHARSADERRRDAHAAFDPNAADGEAADTYRGGASPGGMADSRRGSASNVAAWFAASRPRERADAEGFAVAGRHEPVAAYVDGEVVSGVRGAGGPGRSVTEQSAWSAAEGAARSTEASPVRSAAGVSAVPTDVGPEHSMAADSPVAPRVRVEQSASGPAQVSGGSEERPTLARREPGETWAGFSAREADRRAAVEARREPPVPAVAATTGEQADVAEVPVTPAPAARRDTPPVALMLALEAALSATTTREPEIAVVDAPPAGVRDQDLGRAFVDGQPPGFDGVTTTGQPLPIDPGSTGRAPVVGGQRPTRSPGQGGDGAPWIGPDTIAPEPPYVRPPWIPPDDESMRPVRPVDDRAREQDAPRPALTVVPHPELEHEDGAAALPPAAHASATFTDQWSSWIEPRQYTDRPPTPLRRPAPVLAPVEREPQRRPIPSIAVVAARLPGAVGAGVAPAGKVLAKLNADGHLPQRAVAIGVIALTAGVVWMLATTGTTAYREGVEQRPTNSRVEAPPPGAEPAPVPFDTLPACFPLPTNC